MNSEAPLAESNGFEIAIIGLSCRFPGAKNAEAFWENLKNGVESITFFTDDELLAAGIDPALLDDPNYVRARGALEDVDLFDASFFGVSPREAEIIDPQQRVFLECAWEALEDAGYEPELYPGPIGVYAGVDKNLYLFNIISSAEVAASVGGRRIVLGNEKDYLATRVSYKLNLKGPSLSVQTSCSTSLVAVHLACRALMGGECDMALAGGVSIGVQQKAGYLYEEGEVASPDGHTRAFDAHARGVVDGDGAGVVLLKRLADALSDGDQIDAVIKGSAINNDGSLKVSFTAPSPEGQAKAIRAAQLMAEVAPETITYIEAHGTGTALGDPIEVAALTQAFREATGKKGFCAIGSVKSNIGHLDAAAGIAGLIKTVLALKRRMIPPSLHFQSPNPECKFEESPFYVNGRLSEWKTEKLPRRAGVSSFGIGGANAHVVLEEAPEIKRSPPLRRYELLTLSARTDTALEAQTANLAACLRNQPSLDLSDAAYTLQAGRRAHSHRRVLVCKDAADALAALESEDQRRIVTRAASPGEKAVAFLFPGQGAQYCNMGRDLYLHEPRFRAEVDWCSTKLIELLGVDLRELLFAAGPDAEAADRKLAQTFITQPAIFVISYSLARLWQSWGIRPRAMIGHSIGEYVAACLSGVFSAEDALALVAERGRMMQSIPSGAMLAVELTARQVERRIGPPLSLAAENGPSSCVVAGPTEAIEEFAGALARDEIPARRLNVSHAFHSQMMEPIIEPFAERVSRVELNEPKIPFLSNVSGAWIDPREAADPQYWARHMRRTVRFSEGAAELLDGSLILLEVGPGQTLKGLVAKHGARAELQTILTSMRRSQDRQADDAFILNTLGQLWAAGVAVDWDAFHSGERRHRVHLPTYPFERQRYWIEPSGFGREAAGHSTANAAQSMAAGLDKRKDMADWFYVPVWKQCPAAFVAPAPQSAERPDCLVFLDDCGVGSQLAERLKQQGHAVVSVAAGARFNRVAEDSYEIDPRQQDHYPRLLQELQRAGALIRRIIHAWLITPDDSADIDLPSRASIEELGQDSGFFSLFFLAKALGEQFLMHALANGDPPAIGLVILSNQMQEVTGDERLCPEKATLLGPCRVIPQENPSVTCRSVDIELPGAGTGRARELIDYLLLEITSNRTDPVVAYRGRHRWLQTFEALRVERGDAIPHRLRERGVYLITGGFGGVGFELAKYLAMTVGARLALVGRSAIPESEGPELLSGNRPDRVRERLRQIQELEELGAEVLAANADVTDMEAMQAVSRQIHQRFGALHGIVHAAGLPPGALTQRKEREAASRALAAKVEGARALEAVFKDARLDFFMLCSSIRSFTGGAGAIDYCAANAFLDAFARSRFRESRAAISVNWDGWRDVGMARNTAPQSQDVPREGPREGMTCEEGMEVFARLLRVTAPQVVVSMTDLTARIDQQQRYTTRMALEDLKKAAAKPAHPRPLLDNPYLAPGNETERALAGIWSQLLGIEQVGVTDNFFELGGDSVISIQTIARANQIGIRITPKQVFSHQTIAELAAVADTAPAIRAEQGLVTGEAPMTPIQRRFFERRILRPDHYNQALMLEAGEPIAPEALARVVERLAEHHDALRLRFRLDGGQWRQMNADAAGGGLFAMIDLSALPDALAGPAIERAAAGAQTSLSLAGGPLLKVVLFDLGQARPARVMLIAHHLATDAISWRTLLADLQSGLEQSSRGEPIEFPLKTTSYLQWANRLAAYANSDAVMAESEYWLAAPRRRVIDAPRDFADGENTMASADSVLYRLDAERTRALLFEVHHAYNTQINDVLLTALARCFAAWAGQDLLLVDLEGHGREALFDDVDVSRTAGWFTNIYPALLDLRGVTGGGETLTAVKEQLRAIPNHGMGYGLLRYLNSEPALREELAGLPQAEVVFYYLGQLDQVMASAAAFRMAAEAVGPTQDPRSQRSHLLQISGGVIGGQLQLDWTYSRQVHRRDTIEALARGFGEALEEIIEHCVSAGARRYTPSDFPSVNISQKELDDLVSELSTTGD